MHDLLVKMELAALRARDVARRSGNIHAAVALDLLATEYRVLQKEEEQRQRETSG